MYKQILAVGFGGALGSLSRYILSIWLQGSNFPIGTIVVNCLGSLCLGLLLGIDSRKKMQKWLVLGLGSGFCGGFTTMSTFALDTWQLSSLDHQQAVYYILFSASMGICLAWLGIIWGSRYAQRRNS